LPPEGKVRLRERLAAILAGEQTGRWPRPLLEYADDPLAFAVDGWGHDPRFYGDWLHDLEHVRSNGEFYDEQVDLILSVRDNVETIVPAANQMGKDYVAGFIALWAFLTHPVARIVCTSVREEHLDILFGEVVGWINRCKYRLRQDQGGPLIVNHRHIRKVGAGGVVCPTSYVTGTVSKKGEGMSGHHAPYALLLVDEASAMENEVLDHATGWSKRRYLFGNCWPTENAWRKAVEGGDVMVEGRCFRKVKRIEATQSPNVRLGLEEKARGVEPSGRVLVPGVLSWMEYCERMATFDEVAKTIKLLAQFYLGAQLLLFPCLWIDRAARMAEALRGRPRKAKGIGVDSGEGSANTAMAAVDEMGVIELVARKTPDTNVICGEIIAFLKKHQCDPRNVCLDVGGGGREHADRLRGMGYPVRTIAFGAAPTLELKRGQYQLRERKDVLEDRYAYVNMRAQMYHELSQLLELDGAGNPVGGMEVPNPRPGLPPIRHGFAIPAEYVELRKELAVFPKLTDGEGRYYLPPKNKKDPNSKVKTLVELIGHSPDLADSCALACHAMLHKPHRAVTECFGI